MDLAHILSPEQPGAHLPRPRPTKRARTSATHLSQRNSSTLRCSPPLREVRNRSLPSIRDALSNAESSNFPNDPPSTDYGASSPFHDDSLELEEWTVNDSTSENSNPDSQRGFAQYQQAQVVPGQAIWESLHRDSSAERGSPSANSRQEFAEQQQDQNSNVGQLLSNTHHSDMDSSLLSHDVEIDSDSDSSLFNEQHHHPRTLPHRPSTSRRPPAIDLTAETPSASKAKRKRARPPPLDDEQGNGDPGPSRRPAARAAASQSQKRSRTTQTHVPIESISLIDEDTDPAAASLLSRQRQQQVSSQFQDRRSPSLQSCSSTRTARESARPTKLTAMQCTICMDSPHELTATTCGHTFCRECIQGWLGALDAARQRLRNCPTCRAALNTEAATNSKTKEGCVALEIRVKK